jgi:membrane dipeptidase
VPISVSATDERHLSAWAHRVGVSREALEVHLAAAPLDLHVESFIWTRLLHYDLSVPHDHPLNGGRYLAQADVPRLRDAGMSGAWMSIATNPFRTMTARRRVVRRNVARLRRVLERAGATVVSDASSFDDARGDGRFACFLAVQGANALLPDDVGSPALADVTRVTLVHLTRSRYGTASAPGGGDRGLSAEGRRMVEALRANRVLVDLAHASPRTFRDALDAHGHDVPLIVSHTGVRGAHDHWRNLDDDQIRAVADTGGVVGVLFHGAFLTRPGRRATVDDIVRHIEHVLRVGGEHTPAIGSDYDGLVLPPRELRSVAWLPRLTQALLDRGHPPERVVRILGTNALRPLRAVRP